MADHCCVWLDHREARVFHIAAEGMGEETIHAPSPVHHIHRSADHLGLEKQPVDAAFMGHIADAIADEQAILIAGPGDAKLQFSHFLRDKRPQVAAHVWDVVTMDHPTDAQIVAAARVKFRAGDRMRGQGR